MSHLERARELAKQAQSNSVARRQIAEDFARQNLAECCVEICQQRETNMLVNGGKMEQLREIIGGEDIYAAQRLVEALAAEYIAHQLNRKP